MTRKKSGRTRLNANSRTRQGQQFEDRVAELYKLLGARVTQNIQICQKKVDIFATFSLPGSTIDHRVIVECKDEKVATAQNQRIMQFKGLLDVARAAGQADSAAIITRVPWSDQSKGFARESAIELLTYSQKITQLINFDTYLHDLIELFQKADPHLPGEPPLGSYYVGLKGQLSTEISGSSEEHIEDIPEYVQRWLSNSSGPHLAILGEYGTGKTSLCRKLAHDLAIKHFRTDCLSRIPVLFNLRDFTKSLSLESLVSSFLDEQCDVQNPRFRLFEAMNDAGVFVLIFDGFDEMAVRVDADTLEANLAEIDRLAVKDKARVILTSRVEYFVRAEEETMALRPKGQLLATREAEYQALTLQPWDDTQVGDFLRKRVPTLPSASHGWKYYQDRIAKIPGLADLSKRPVLLEMIVKTLPKLIETGAPIDRPNLYHTYLRGELRRQTIVKKRRLLLSADKRFLMLQNLALDFLTAEAKCINFEKANECVLEQLAPPKSELEAYVRDFLSCSFLVRKGDDFVFSHRSLLEFLAANALLREITDAKPEAFRNIVLEPVVAGFLAEMACNTRRLWYWVRQTGKRDTGQHQDYLPGNALTILCLKNPNCLKGKNLSGTALRYADFGEANLLTTDFSNAILDQCNFEKAWVAISTLRNARLRNSHFSLIAFGRIPRGKKHSKEILEEFDYLLHKSSRNKKGLCLIRSYFIQTVYSENDRYFVARFLINVPNSKSLQSLKGLQMPTWIERTAVDFGQVRQIIAECPEGVRRHLSTDMFLPWAFKYLVTQKSEMGDTRERP